MQRGVQGVRDEVQDILFLVLKLCCPGAADEKAAVLKLLTDPQPCSRADTALNELQKYWASARRCRQLGVTFPDVSILYTVMRSIFGCFRAG